MFQSIWRNLQSTEFQRSPAAAKGPQGFSQLETLTVGGQTPDALDAANEPTYLLLESRLPLRNSHPEMGVRIHANTPDFVDPTPSQRAEITARTEEGID